MVSSDPVALRGPNTQRSSCLWHLQAAPGSQLELRMEWLLPECRDRLLVYNSLTPTDTHLITSWVFQTLLGLIALNHCFVFIRQTRWGKLSSPLLSVSLSIYPSGLSVCMAAADMSAWCVSCPQASGWRWFGNRVCTTTRTPSLCRRRPGTVRVRPQTARDFFYLVLALS